MTLAATMAAVATLVHFVSFVQPADPFLPLDDAEGLSGKTVKKGAAVFGLDCQGELVDLKPPT